MIFQYPIGFTLRVEYNNCKKSAGTLMKIMFSDLKNRMFSDLN